LNDHDLPELNQGTYLKETSLALWEGLPRILLAELFFSLVSLPAILLFLLGFVIPGILLGVFSMAPGYAALCAGIARSILREPTSFWDFPKAFAHFYWRGVLLGFLFSLPLISASLLLPSLQNPPVATFVWVGLGADLAMLFFLTALYLYIYPQIVIYDLQVNTALKNSLRLAARYFGNTLGLISMAILLVLLASRVNYLLLIVFLGFWQVFVINNCRMVIHLELG
jgi:uncharacterized membrane protein YesL